MISATLNLSLAKNLKNCYYLFYPLSVLLHSKYFRGRSKSRASRLHQQTCDR